MNKRLNSYNIIFIQSNTFVIRLFINNLLINTINMGCVCNYKKSDEEVTELDLKEKNDFVPLSKSTHPNNITNVSFDEKMNTIDNKSPPINKLVSPEIQEQILFTIDENTPKEKIIESLDVDIIAYKDTTDELPPCKLIAKKSKTAINIVNNNISQVDDDTNDNTLQLKKSNTNVFVPSINISYSTEQNINDNDVFYLKKSDTSTLRNSNRLNTTKLTIANNSIKNNLLHFQSGSKFNKKLSELGNIEELIENLDKENILKRKMISDKNVHTIV